MTDTVDQERDSAMKSPAGMLYSGEHSTPDGYSFRMHIGEDGIGIAVSNGFETEALALNLRSLFLEAREVMGKPYRMCFDITNLEGMEPRARKIWSDTALDKNGPFSRVAVHGGGFFIMSLMNFYARIARIPVRCFKTRADAIAWLGEDDR